MDGFAGGAPLVTVVDRQTTPATLGASLGQHSVARVDDAVRGGDGHVVLSRELPVTSSYQHRLRHPSLDQQHQITTLSNR